MDLEKYSVIKKAENDVLTFQFISDGPKGKITKIVQFTQIEGNFYNLAFGDYCEEEDKLDDQSLSGNGDRDKVLATVANCFLEYSREFPEHAIFAAGSTPARTRLYQMGIARYRQQIEMEFDILGEYENKWVPFAPNINFKSFLIYRNSANFINNNQTQDENQ